ncbi:MAG: hypothetical protein IIC73_07625 [Armatimonadetes bacterium]|nr:hypothetical protein [Armatimonadota bacterium]
MNRNSLIALAALAAALLAVGCSSNYETGANDEGAPAVTADDPTDAVGDPGVSDDDGDVAAAASTEMTLASNVYQKDGVAYCPVMGNPIPDLSLAAGSREYEDKTYYFC